MADPNGKANEDARAWGIGGPEDSGFESLGGFVA
jgi:hypothetical protein